MDTEEISETHSPTVGAQSPVQEAVILLGFPEAIKGIIDGKKIRRDTWPEGEYGMMKDGCLIIKRDKEHQWLVKDGDLLATDWMVIK